MAHDRRSATARVLRGLAGEIARRRAELAALERAHDVLERDLTEHPDRCESYRPDNPCAGQLYSRWCTTCGATILRCEEHGGLRGAGHVLDRHRATAHP